MAISGVVISGSWVSNRNGYQRNLGSKWNKTWGIYFTLLGILQRWVILPKSQVYYFYRYHAYITGFFVVPKALLYSRNMQLSPKSRAGFYFFLLPEELIFMIGRDAQISERSAGFCSSMKQLGCVSIRSASDIYTSTLTRTFRSVKFFIKIS